jgi:Tfp pilus assembly protein FimV
MAIALVPDVDEAVVDELPWPRPALRLVLPQEGPVRREISDPPLEQLPAVRAAVDVSVRRHRRTLRRTRQRRTAAALVVAGAVALLCLPIASLAGRPLAAHPATAAGVPSAGTLTYVVQPGDTLWSIASRFDANGDPRALAEQLQAQTGSATVVPGERLRVP